jgi:hypothetical protein
VSRPLNVATRERGRAMNVGLTLLPQRWTKKTFGHWLSNERAGQSRSLVLTGAIRLI